MSDELEQIQKQKSRNGQHGLLHNATKTMPSKLEELEVIFVSGVEQPATGEKFILLKDLQGVSDADAARSAFSAWARVVRKNNPAAAADLDMYLQTGDIENLGVAMKTLDGGTAMWETLREQLAALGQQPTLWNEIEPTEKELDALETADPVTYLDFIVYKSEWTHAKRAEHKANGGYFAGANMSFPVKTCADVHAAYMAANRAKGVDPDTIRERVTKYARVHDMGDCLPETAQAATKSHARASVIHTTQAKDPAASKVSTAGLQDDSIAMPQASPKDDSNKKKGGVGMTDRVMKALAQSLAASAGFDLVPRGTAQQIEQLQQAAQLVGKTIANGAGADDKPVDGTWSGLNDKTVADALVAGTPKDDNGGDGSHSKKTQQPVTLQGTPFAGSASTKTVLSGTPFDGSADDTTVLSGTPATKSTGKKKGAACKNVTPRIAVKRGMVKKNPFARSMFGH